MSFYDELTAEERKTFEEMEKHLEELELSEDDIKALNDLERALVSISMPDAK